MSDTIDYVGHHGHSIRTVSQGAAPRGYLSDQDEVLKRMSPEELTMYVGIGGFLPHDLDLKRRRYLSALKNAHGIGLTDRQAVIAASIEAKFPGEGDLEWMRVCKRIHNARDRRGSRGSRGSPDHSGEAA